MSDETKVEGNRVTIDSWVYDVKAVGGGKYTVTDGFGGKLGFFRMKDNDVVAEDWGLPDAPSVKKIGRLWAKANRPGESKAPAPRSKMVCALASHATMESADRAKANAYGAWLKAQPGCKLAFFAEDSSSGKVVSVSVWKTKAHLAALKNKKPPEGAPAPEQTSMEVFALSADL